jgi:hypothetical protein
MAASVERAKAGDVGSEARGGTAGASERAAAWRLLEVVEARGRVSRGECEQSLGVPPGAEFLESTLLRFLRARQGDVDKAAAMMEECMALRRRLDLDNILSKPLAKEMLNHVRKGLCDGLLPTTCRSGRPVYVLRGGVSSSLIADMLRAPASVGAAAAQQWGLVDVADVFLHAHLIMIEYMNRVVMARASAVQGRAVNKYVVVDDLSGFSLVGLRGLMSVMGAFKQMAALDQLLYPEELAILVFVNSPAIFNAAWRVISSFLDRDTVAKIFVLGSTSASKATLDALFDPASTPPFLGGTLQGHHVGSHDNPDSTVFVEIDSLVTSLGARAGWDAAKRCEPMKAVNVVAKKESEIALAAAAGDIVEWHVGVESGSLELVAELLCSGQQPERLDSAKVDSSEWRYQRQVRLARAGTVKIKLTTAGSLFAGSRTARYRLFAWRPKESAEASLAATSAATRQAAGLTPLAPSATAASSAPQQPQQPQQNQQPQQPQRGPPGGAQASAAAQTSPMSPGVDAGEAAAAAIGAVDLSGEMPQPVASGGKAHGTSQQAANPPASPTSPTSHLSDPGEATDLGTDSDE